MSSQDQEQHPPNSPLVPQQITKHETHPAHPQDSPAALPAHPPPTSVSTLQHPNGKPTKGPLGKLKKKTNEAAFNSPTDKITSPTSKKVEEIRRASAQR